MTHTYDVYSLRRRAAVELHSAISKNKQIQGHRPHQQRDAICETDTRIVTRWHTCGHQLQYLIMGVQVQKVSYCGGNGGIRVARVVKGRFVVGWLVGWMEGNS